MGLTTIEKPHLLALYKVAYCITKAIKPHALAEKVTSLVLFTWLT